MRLSIISLQIGGARMEDISNGFNHLTASSSRLSENFSLNSQKKLEFSFLTNSADATAT